MSTVTSNFLPQSRVPGKLFIALILLWMFLSTAFWFHIMDQREYYGSIDVFAFQPVGKRIKIDDVPDRQNYFELTRGFRLPDHLREMHWDPNTESYMQARLWSYVPDGNYRVIDSVEEFDSKGTLVKKYSRLDESSAGGAAHQVVTYLPNGRRNTLFFTSEGLPATDFRGVYWVHSTYNGDLLKREIFKDTSGKLMLTSSGVSETQYEHSGDTLEKVTFMQSDSRELEELRDESGYIFSSSQFINGTPVNGDSGYHRSEQINTALGKKEEIYFDLNNRRIRGSNGFCSYQAMFDEDGNREAAVWDYIDGCSGMPANDLPAKIVNYWVNGALYAVLTTGHDADWLSDRNKSEAIRYFQLPDRGQTLQAHFYSENRVFLRFVDQD